MRSYVADRHGFEARYQALSDAERAALAVRQGATYVVAAAPSIAGAQTRVSTVNRPSRAAARRGPLRGLPGQVRSCSSSASGNGADG